MGYYSKPQLELLCDQINRDNPELGAQLDPTTLVLLTGPLSSNLGTSKRNTRIIVNGVMGKGTSGKREVFYDRIILSKLTAKQPGGMVITFGNKVTTLASALPDINAAFGLSLTAADILQPDTMLGLGNTPTLITVTGLPTCLCFIGTFSFKWRRGAAGYYPNSGPGSKQMLIGDMTEGYFGAVSAAAVLPGGEFYRQMTEALASRGTMAPQNNPTLFYLKFAIDGKFVFVPTQSLVSSVTWEQLYRMGAIDASDGEAKFPPVAVQGVRQGALVVTETAGKPYWLRPRLAKISTTDPATTAKGDATSDFERMFNKVHKGENGTGVWDTLPTGGNGIDLSANQWLQNSAVVNTEQAHLGTFNLSTLTVALKTVVNNWRPVLELIDPAKTLVPLRKMSYEIVGPAAPILYTIEDSTVHLTGPVGISFALAGYSPLIFWDGSASDQLTAVSQLHINGNVEFVQPIYWSADVTQTV